MAQPSRQKHSTVTFINRCKQSGWFANQHDAKEREREKNESELIDLEVLMTYTNNEVNDTFISGRGLYSPYPSQPKVYGVVSIILIIFLILSHTHVLRLFQSFNLSAAFTFAFSYLSLSSDEAARVYSFQPKETSNLNQRIELTLTSSRKKPAVETLKR